MVPRLQIEGRTQGVLEEIGLTGSEAKVYLALLEIGDTTRNDIVNASGIAGSKVYEILDRLQGKGLVAIYLKEGVKHFKALDPKQLLYYVEEQKRKLDVHEQYVQQLLPRLLMQYDEAKEEQEVELIQGLRGLEVLFREQVELLKKGDVCYVIGGTKEVEEEAIVAFFQKVHLLREEKGIKTKMLYNVRQRKMVEDVYGSRMYPGTVTRFIAHSSPVAINVYKDRTVILIFGREISAIQIRSAAVAESFMEYFRLLWRKGM